MGTHILYLLEDRLDSLCQSTIYPHRRSVDVTDRLRYAAIERNKQPRQPPWHLGPFLRKSQNHFRALARNEACLVCIIIASIHDGCCTAYRICHKVGCPRLGISVFFDTSIHLIINGYGPKVLGKKKKKKGKRRSLPTPHRPN